jgi:hypothetical protein
VHPEHQRYWVSLLNLQRTWSHDEAAFSFVPPRYRDFESAPAWPRDKALAYLLNNLELVRESHRRLEAGELLDFEMLNLGLGGLTLRLHPWRSVREAQAAARSRLDLGGRLETLQVTTGHPDVNPGTRYVRATVERSLFYFAQYVDERLSDPAYPAVSEGRWQVVRSPDGSGDLVLRAPNGETLLP